MKKESYESLFFSNVLENNNMDKSIETVYNKLKEQNDINSQSTEDESDDGGSFEAAADESSSSDNSSNESSSSDDSSDTDLGSDDSFDSGNGGDDDFGDLGGDSSDEDSASDNNGDKEGLDSLDNNKGSSLNPFTQINQKTYHIDRLNELKCSISNAVDEYSALFADWSEVDQLKELLNIVSEEENSFIMQQNPENLIKLGLYYEQYEKIIQNISIKISRLKSNDKI